MFSSKEEYRYAAENSTKHATQWAVDFSYIFDLSNDLIMEINFYSEDFFWFSKYKNHLEEGWLV